MLPDIHQTATLLSKTDLFGSLDEQVCRELAERSSCRVYRRGQVVFVQDEPCGHLFVVAEGAVKLLIRSSKGDAVELGRVGPVDVFGQVALLDGGPRSATAEAAGPTVLIAVTRAELLRLVQRHEPVLDALLRSLGALVRRANRQLTDLVFLDLRARVAKKLWELTAGQAGGGPRGVLDPRVTQADLAQMVGGARQSVNQVLRTLEDRHYIKVTGRTIEVLRHEELERLGGW